MSITAAEEKALLRAQMKERLSALSAEERRRGDDALFDRFLALEETRAAGTVLLFWGTGLEPDTSRLALELIRRGKMVCLPRCLPGRGMEMRRYQPECPLRSGPFGLLEPSPSCPLVEPEEIDLALIPALCYDRRGYRLGFGGGYYDRWLPKYPGLRVGLCRRCVLRERVPAQEHDCRVDLVLTEEESLSFR